MTPTAIPWAKAANTARWLPRWAVQRLTRRSPERGPGHVLIALADHFEPSFLPSDPEGFADRDEQRRRVERWCREYPRRFDRWRDADGVPFRHTYFYPAEQHDDVLIELMADHCRAGWGEMEIHLHHGRHAPDTADETRRALVAFRDALARHGCLSAFEGSDEPRYAFVHGNWALANSGGGQACGVDDEMRVLAETGCYADFTLPSAPNRAQVAKINALYECGGPLDERAPHRIGRDLEVGRRPETLPLIMQGPLDLDWSRRRRGLPLPTLENAELSGRNPPTLARLRLWLRTAVHVRGRADWVFVKLHCHGMDPRDDSLFLGSGLPAFLEELAVWAAGSGRWRLHYVTAREMVNVALAACDGKTGDPGEYRDYGLKPLGSPR